MLTDFCTDDGLQMMAQIRAKHVLPDYVARANAGEIRRHGPIDKCASVTEAPRLSCHSKAACWLSHAYYLQQRDGLPPEARGSIESFLAKQAAFWGIEGDVQQLVATEVTLHKIASASEDEELPLRSPQEVRAAANWLTENLTKLAEDTTVPERVRMAGRILDEAGELVVSLPDDQRDMLQKVACRSGCVDGQRSAHKLAEVLASPTADAFSKEAVAAIGQCREELLSLRGHTLQSKHAELAVRLEQTGCVQLPELLLAQDPVEPVVELANGAIYTKAAFEQATADWSYRKESVLRVGRGPRGLSKAAAEGMSRSEADELVSRLADQGCQPLLAPRAPADLQIPLQAAD